LSSAQPFAQLLRFSPVLLATSRAHKDTPIFRAACFPFVLTRPAAKRGAQSPALGILQRNARERTLHEDRPGQVASRIVVNGRHAHLISDYPTRTFDELNSQRMQEAFASARKRRAVTTQYPRLFPNDNHACGV
jgi:hypothetical protein